MSVHSVDASLEHLFPEFRRKLIVVLAETGAALGEEWIIAEGYRSQARQTWLYEQGRSRPGNIVTWMKSPQWHGAGLAADCIPKAKGYNAPHDWFEMFRHVYHSHGLENPAWAKGDYSHVQLTDAALRVEALAWIARGFRD